VRASEPKNFCRGEVGFVGVWFFFVRCGVGYGCLVGFFLSEIKMWLGGGFWVRFFWDFEQ
jgi:hypothetical protein